MCPHLILIKDQFRGIEPETWWHSKSNGEQKRLPKLCFDHSEQLLHSVYSYLLNFQLCACIFNFLCRLSFLFATDVFLEKLQKGVLVSLGRPRRLFDRSNLISSRWVWLELKLIQYFMPVLVTCKFDDDPIKNTGAIVSTTFLSALKGR